MRKSGRPLIEAITAPKTDHQAAAMAKAVAHSEPALWATQNIRLPTGEPYNLARHVYQFEPLTLEHPKVSIRKATQGGWTLLYILKMFFGMIRGTFKQGVIYLFPTDVKVREFSRLRWTPLLDINPVSLAAHVRNTNQTHVKQIGSSMLMFRGARLTERISGLARESTALRGDPADVVVFDERDLMPPNIIAKALKRMAHSDLKWQISLSNPTIPNYGIDACWNESDQRHWMVRCDACNHWSCLEIEFPRCLRRELSGKVTRICVKCDAPVNIDHGQWSPKFPSRSADHVGYWWSQLISHFVTGAEILHDFEHPPEGNIADVHRLTLGRPYLDAKAGISAAQVLLCCGKEPAASASETPTAIGVDVGKRLHVVVGYRLHADCYRIIAVLLLDGWKELTAVAKCYNAEITCIDNEPEIHAAREYQSSGPGEVWLSDYVKSVQPAHYNPEQRVVRVNRTEILDDSGYTIRTPGKLVIPSHNAYVGQFADECANMAKVIQKDELTGAQDAVYVTLGPDHYRHAFVNFLLAAKRQYGILDRRKRTEPTEQEDYDLYD